MISGGSVKATITSTRNKDVTATTSTNICFLGARCPISSGEVEFEINAPIRPSEEDVFIGELKFDDKEGNALGCLRFAFSQLGLDSKQDL